MQDRGLLFMIPEVTEDNVAELIDEVGRTQPYLSAYMMTYAEDILNPDEQAILFDHFLLVWYLRTKSEAPPAKASTALIDKKQRKNHQMSRYLAKEPQEDAERTVQLLSKNYKSFDLLDLAGRMLYGELLAERIRPKGYELMLGALKTAIDCMEPDNENQS